MLCKQNLSMTLHATLRSLLSQHEFVSPLVLLVFSIAEPTVYVYLYYHSQARILRRGQRVYQAQKF